MNLNLYGYAGKWLMVDFGVTFGDDAHAGHRGDHARPRLHRGAPRAISSASSSPTRHEDHIGAVPYLWPRLRCPVYATPFTAALLRRKLREAEARRRGPTSRRFRCPAASTLGPFELELITLTHSIPEPNAVVIRTPAGTVLHTGDWKLDPEPLSAR